MFVNSLCVCVCARFAYLDQRLEKSYTEWITYIVTWTRAKGAYSTFFCFTSYLLVAANITRSKSAQDDNRVSQYCQHILVQ